MPDDLPGPDLTDLRCFLQVVESGSFSAAALALGLPKASLSRRVAALERRLGTQLLARTTRSVRCTAAGADYARRVGPALDALLEAGSALVARPSGLRGALRLRAPRDYAAAVLAPRLAEFQHLHPALDIELLVGEEGGAAPDLRVVAGGAPGPDRELLEPVHAGLYASPAFRAGLGPLAYAHELDGVAGLCAVGVSSWALTDGTGTLRLSPRPVLRSDSTTVLQVAAEAGLGVALLPTGSALEAVDQGRLCRLFPAWRTVDEPLFAVWSGADGPTPKVRALIDHLIAARPGAQEEAS